MTLYVIALASVLAVSADQAGSPPPGGSVETGRVIRKLPPVTFDNARTPAPDQPEPAAGVANRRRAEAALRALMAQESRKTTTRTICGLTVIEQSPDLDAKILMPPDRSEGAAVRRIEPQSCTADSSR
jgi:hypothetical protein